MPHDPAQRVSAEADLDPGRRCRAADPEAAAGLVLSRHLGTAPTHRSSPVCGSDGDGGERGLHSFGRRSGRGRWGSGRASPSPKCRGSAPDWTSRSPRSVTGRCITRVPVCVPRCHLLARPPHRTGHLDGRRDRHRGHHRRRPGDPRRRRRRPRNSTTQRGAINANASSGGSGSTAP
jgi:hypothetical protein